jgi:hypothetical protein
MEILKKYKKFHEGNDCWISEYVCLIQLDHRLYVVTYTDSVEGSWTGSPKTATSETFVDYTEAVNCFDSIVEKLEK